MEMDLYDKKIECPVCNNPFTSKRIRTSQVKVQKIHPDFYTEYKGENPNYYAIFVCPQCGYSAFEKEYTGISEKVKKTIREKVTVSWRTRDFGQMRSHSQAIETYKLALVCYTLTGGSNSTIAKIAMRLLWLYREIEDLENEERYRTLALKYFTKSYEEDRFDETNKDELLQIMFMAGELSRQSNLYSDAIKWFSMLLKDPDIKKARHLELRAKDLWAETSAAYRSKGGIIDENE